tara:strand:- start:395 stop:952 length:558 start_codon:yes stop_codon:yes gene_type:complete
MTKRYRNNLIALLIVTVFLVGLANAADPIVTDSTNNVTTTGTQVTTVKSPPPSAISTNIGGSNSDLCTISSSGAMGTQVLSLSLGATYTEANCLRLKKASKLYTFGMKVAAVSVMCQDPDVWQAMMDAGTPCPIDGLIGNEAKAAWEVRQDLVPMPEGENELTAEQKRNKAFNIIGAVAGAVLLF